MIPKLIHYCWLSKDPFPIENQKCIKTWKEKLADYQFILWDTNRFDVNIIRWVKEAYETKRYAFAADYIRLFAVYNYGGIYLDTDVEVIKPFDPLLNNSCMLAYENDRTKLIEAGCFGAEKGFWFIKNCLDYYNGRRFVKVNQIDDTVVLPRIMKTIYNHSHIETIAFYSSSYFTVKNFMTGELSIKKETHAIHHFAGSWLTDTEKRYHVSKKKVYISFGRHLGFMFSVPLLLIFLVQTYGLFDGLKRFIEKIRNHFANILAKCRNGDKKK
jgi:hypothetical protein